VVRFSPVVVDDQWRSGCIGGQTKMPRAATAGRPAIFSAFACRDHKNQTPGHQFGAGRNFDDYNFAKNQKDDALSNRFLCIVVHACACRWPQDKMHPGL
jgi:hypothetical protein